MTNLQFIDLYQSNYTALYNFAKKLSNDINDAEDLVQDTAVKAFKNFHTFQIGTSFKSWAFTILKNTFISKYRKNKKRKNVSAPIEDMAYAISKNNIITNPAETNMRTEEIEQCIEELSYKSRIPFLMHIAGYQYNEIADALNLPLGTIKSRINFARTKLKESLLLKGIAA